MGEIIRRDLTPGVGQNQLQKWLKSTQVSDPVKTQNPELQVCQELQPFQQRYRQHEDSQQLTGGEVQVVFDATVPTDEAWLVDHLWVEHNKVTALEWEVVVNRAALMDRQAVIARLVITPNVMSPLIGGYPPETTVTDRIARAGEAQLFLPGDLITVRNPEDMAAPEVGRIQIRYRLAPLPIEILAATGWAATTN